jgi:hypothetical protein
MPIPLYYINMDRSEARRHQMEKRLREVNKSLHPYTIVPRRVPALDAKKMDLKHFVQGEERTAREEDAASDIEAVVRELIHDIVDEVVGEERNPPCCIKDISMPEVCCTYSHLKCFAEMLRDGVDCALVGEDDIDLQPIADHFEVWQHYLASIPADAGIVQLVSVGRDSSNAPYDSDAPFVRWSPTFYSTCLYYVTPTGLQDLAAAYLRHGKPRLPAQITRAWVADSVLYKSTKTYTTNLPFCMIQAEESTIHESHLAFHAHGASAAQAAWARYETRHGASLPAGYAAAYRGWDIDFGSNVAVIRNVSCAREAAARAGGLSFVLSDSDKMAYVKRTDTTTIGLNGGPRWRPAANCVLYLAEAKAPRQPHASGART